jgi:hypothetical protein
VEAAHHLKSARCLDGNVARPISIEAEGDTIDPIDQARNVSRWRCRYGESIDPVAVSGNSLYLIEMHPDAQIPARHFGRVRSSPHDRADDHRIANRSGKRRNRNPVANLEMRSRRECLIDRDGTRLPLYRRGGRATNRR